MDRDFRHVLTSVNANTHTDSWSVSHADIPASSTSPWSVTVRGLHGGSQEGVSVIDVENGALRFTVVPTRGMSVHRVTCGDLVLGWDSPVKQIIHGEE